MPDYISPVVADGPELDALLTDVKDGGGAFAPAVLKYYDIVSLADYVGSGIDLTGLINSSPGIATANSEITASKKVMQVPAGEILLNSTFEPTCPLVGVKGGKRSDEVRSVFKPGMTDGTACIKYRDRDRYYIEDIAVIVSGINDPALSQNCILLDVGDRDGPGVITERACSRGEIHNVYLVGGATGLYHLGWQNALKVFIKFCGLGMQTGQSNNISGQIDIEDCSKWFEFDGVNSSVFDRLLCQGSIGDTPSTMDNMANTRVVGGYFEQHNRTSSMLIIGGSGFVRNIKVSGSIAGSGMSDDPVVVDDGENIDFTDTYFNTGSDGSSVRYTGNATDIPKRPLHIASGFNRTAFNNNIVRPVENFFPNSRFDRLRFGLDISPTRVTISEETVDIRTGRSAMRLTCDAGQNFNAAVFVEKNPLIIAALQNKTITFAAWVKIPNISTYEKIGQTMFPGIVIQTSLASVNQQSGSTNTSYPILNNWMFMHCSVDAALAFDRVDYKFFPNNSGNNSSAGEYIIVDFAAVVIGDVWKGIYAGDVVDSDLNYFRLNAGAATLRMLQAESASARADNAQIWSVGDKFEYTDVAPGGIQGVYCTTGGAGGGVAVWKTLPVIGT